MPEEIAPHQRPIVHRVPGMDQVQVRRDVVYHRAAGKECHMDVYLPPTAAGEPALPGVLFIHGGPVPADRAGSVKGMGQYRSWGALAAASGMVSFTFNHHYDAPKQLERAVTNVSAAVDYVRREAGALGIDPNRLCLWTCSGGGPLICFALRHKPPFVRCLVLYYAILDARRFDWLVGEVGQETAARYSPVRYLEEPPPFPVFVGRAGQDDPVLNETMDDFVTRALGVNAALEVMNHPQGEHGFDVANDDARSRQIVARTLAFMRENLA